MIEVLPGHIANLIAAGEVIQRPSSVVKELIENSIDAQATKIDLLIRDSGRTTIQVKDNGIGLSREDAKKAFLRHATSKIVAVEDLDSIHTLGFRGEALPSISAVSQVTLRSRRGGDETGIELRFSQSEFDGEEEVVTPAGTIVTVSNIFYNLPARRKFLKSDATELRQIVQEFTRIALSRSQLSFELSHNGKELFVLKPANLKQRIKELVGREVANGLVELKVETSIVKVNGYIGRPEDARKSAGNQYLFVNGRFFRSGYIQKAIVKGYEEVIPEGYIPSFFIFLEVDPSKVDVNIHPAKAEVKFEEDWAIFDILHSVVRESLGKNALVPGIDFDREGAHEMPKVKMGQYLPPPKIDYDPLFNPFIEEGGERVDSIYHNIEEKGSKDLEGIKELFSDPRYQQQATLLLGERFIVTTIKSGLVIVDAYRARERILYERYLPMLSSKENLTRQMLFPERVALSLSHYNTLYENREELLAMGFIVGFLDEEIEINGVPEGLSDLYRELLPLMESLAQELEENGKERVTNNGAEQRAQYLAKVGSQSREPINRFEQQSLVDALFACKEPNFTPHGKRTHTIFDIDWIDNFFKR
ncbi:MAG: DNA mismatch repair endonuclease MutL [Bacteroidales bacterium]